MKLSQIKIAVLILCAGCCANSASALTMRQFAAACDAYASDCSTHPTLQAYVGGALDLLATLDEQTNYLTPLYCTDPQGLFDVPAIIEYMQRYSEQYAADNAMLALVRYFEEHGGCKR
jgi:hypothetical protein